MSCAEGAWLAGWLAVSEERVRVCVYVCVLMRGAWGAYLVIDDEAETTQLSASTCECLGDASPPFSHHPFLFPVSCGLTYSNAFFF